MTINFIRYSWADGEVLPGLTGRLLARITNTCQAAPDPLILTALALAFAYHTLHGPSVWNWNEEILPIFPFSHLCSRSPYAMVMMQTTRDRVGSSAFSASQAEYIEYKSLLSSLQAMEEGKGD